MCGLEFEIRVYQFNHSLSVRLNILYNISETDRKIEIVQTLLIYILTSYKLLSYILLRISYYLQDTLNAMRTNTIFSIFINDT